MLGSTHPKKPCPSLLLMDDMISNAVEESGHASKAQVFISYSRKDMAFADRLEAALKARGFEPLIDRTDIMAFEEWWKRVEVLIARADTVVFVLSPDAIRSGTVALKEVAFAASLNKRFAPIVFRAVDDKSVPEELAKFNFIFFDDATRFEQSADQLAEALNTDISWIRQHTEFGDQARRWALAKAPSGLLLRSPVLEQAERWIAARPPGAPTPTEETQTFIAESRRGATRRRNLLTVTLAAGLFIALALAAFAYWELSRNEALLDRTLQRATGLVNRAIAMSEQFGVPHTVSLGVLQEAEGLFADMSELGRDTAQLRHRKAIMLIEFGRNYAILGNTAAEAERATGAVKLMLALVAEQPGNLVWRSDLSAAHSELGNTLVDEGKLAEALDAYRASLAIRKELVRANPDNNEWQGDLEAAYRAVGGILAPQGKLSEALDNYRASVTIVERLISVDPQNTTWQSHLALASYRIGDIVRDQGNLVEALDHFRTSVEIQQRLVLADPRNGSWQRNLSFFYSRVGDILRAQGKFAGALENQRASLAIREKLVASDPTNSLWQRDFAWAHSRIGDVLGDQRKLAEALDNYGASVAVFERINRANPNNAARQRELAIQRSKIGDVLLEQMNFVGALDNYRASFAILERVATADRANAEWQCELSMQNDKIGNALLLQGKVAEAFEYYRVSSDIRQRLTVADPTNPIWQQKLSVSYEKIGDLLSTLGRPEEALENLRASLAIRERLVDSDATNVLWRRDLELVRSKIARLLGEDVPADGVTETPRRVARPLAFSCGTPLAAGSAAGLR
jgi:tetratricopeptide (TPR) repeat protein